MPMLRSDCHQQTASWSISWLRSIADPCPPSDLARASKLARGLQILGSGGERGIRTPVTLSRKHTFQACAFNHSATSPSGGSAWRFRQSSLRARGLRKALRVGRATYSRNASAFKRRFAPICAGTCCANDGRCGEALPEGRHGAIYPGHAAARSGPRTGSRR